MSQVKGIVSTSAGSPPSVMMSKSLHEATEASNSWKAVLTSKIITLLPIFRVTVENPG